MILYGYIQKLLQNIHSYNLIQDIFLEKVLEEQTNYEQTITHT